MSRLLIGKVVLLLSVFSEHVGVFELQDRKETMETRETGALRGRWESKEAEASKVSAAAVPYHRSLQVHLHILAYTGFFFLSFCYLWFLTNLL